MKSRIVASTILCSLCMGAAPERPASTLDATPSLQATGSRSDPLEAAGVSNVEVRPTLLRLDRPPAREHRCSFLLRHKGEGPMNVLSAVATDAAIAVEVKEHAAGSVYVVTATLPAGYHTPAGKDVHLLITTDMTDKPVIRIPVSVSAEPPPVLDPWMARPRAMVGRPAPAVTLKTADGCEIRLGDAASTPEKATGADGPSAPAVQSPQPPASGLSLQRDSVGQSPRRPGSGPTRQAPRDRLTAVMFWTGRCGHCVRQLPVFQRVAESYADRAVEFVTVCAGDRNAAQVADAAGQRGLRLPVGLDPDYTAARRYAIRAFPFVCLIGKDGRIESVHGRRPTYDDKDGLENLEGDLRSQLDRLLALDTPGGRTPLTEPGGPASPASQGPAGKARGRASR